MTACIDLALVFKCDPFIFLDLPAEQVNAIYSATNKRLKDQADNSE